MAEAKNVLGGPLELCSKDPLTGFFRTGNCATGPSDSGTHVVCSQVTEAFLTFTRNRGNDLSTPSPASGFPGLKPGDYWCLCARRWLEALEAGVAPPIRLAATHVKALDYVDLKVLKEYAVKDS